jgi:hypothetical protein
LLFTALGLIVVWFGWAVVAGWLLEPPFALGCTLCFTVAGFTVCEAGEFVTGPLHWSLGPGVVVCATASELVIRSAPAARPILKCAYVFINNPFWSLAPAG